MIARTLVFTMSLTLSWLYREMCCQTFLCLHIRTSQPTNDKLDNDQLIECLNKCPIINPYKRAFSCFFIFKWNYPLNKTLFEPMKTINEVRLVFPVVTYITWVIHSQRNPHSASLRFLVIYHFYNHKYSRCIHIASKCLTVGGIPIGMINQATGY